MSEDGSRLSGRTPVSAPLSRAGANTVGALVAEVAGRLLGRIDDAAGEARDIVAALYDVPRFWPAMQAHVEVDDDTRARALRAAELRTRGAPLAYAVGRAAFRHLTLDVDERVLIPRPETELLVDLVLEAAGARRGGTAVDVGTGSGAIALALASEGPFARVVATDLSLDALAVARRNARAAAAVLRAPVEFRHGSLLAPLRDERAGARVVVCNPPYIAYDEAQALPASVRDWEPPLALFSGGDGLAVTARLVREAVAALEPGGLLALEVDVRRASLVAELVGASADYTDVRVRLDLTGRERFVLAVRR